LDRDQFDKQKCSIEEQRRTWLVESMNSPIKEIKVKVIHLRVYEWLTAKP